MNEINIISSDARYDALNEIFLANGYKSKICTPDTVSNPEILILPIKSTLTDREIFKIFQNADKSALVFSPSNSIIKECFSGTVVNYASDERFLDKNAYITAECALCLALNRLRKTLFGSKCAVIGYGRIGKHLSRLMKNIGAHTMVFARREESRESARKNGLISKPIGDITRDFHDVIFNTVPEKIISREMSARISSKSIVLDLASLPGGFEDEGFAERALSLPGKMMPVSAGKAIYDFVEEYIFGERKNV